jgi:glutathione S-transferase
MDDKYLNCGQTNRMGNSMPNIRLVSFKLCPFVQRCVMLLQEKQIDYDIDYIDLADRPDWFIELSPLGKVPLLEVTRDDNSKVVLFESVVINEYLDEVTPGSLLPTEPLDRAHSRAWIEYGNALLSKGADITSARDEEALAKASENLGKLLDRLEQEIDDGPFFSGSEVSLVDATFTPALQRLAWTNEIHPALDIFKGRPKIWRWWQALDALDSVHNSAVADLRQRYDSFVSRDRGGYQSLVGALVG